MQRKTQRIIGGSIAAIFFAVVGYAIWDIYLILPPKPEPYTAPPPCSTSLVQRLINKKHPTLIVPYLLFLYETYNGFPGLGQNLPEVNAGTCAIQQLNRPFALQELKDMTARLLTNPRAFNGESKLVPAILEWLNAIRGLRGHLDSDFAGYLQPVIDNYAWLRVRNGFRYSRAPLYEWTLYLSETGVVPDAVSLFHGKPFIPLHYFEKEDIFSFAKAILQNSMVAEDAWTEQAMKTIGYLCKECNHFDEPLLFQPDSYQSPSPDRLMSEEVLIEWENKHYQEMSQQFPVIQVWRDPRRFYPTKQYELDLKTLMPERMREIGEEADAELCQKIAAGPLPRADRFPMFLFDPEIRPAVFLAYDKAFLADPPVPGYGESMERYLALREKLHWLNSHSRYAKYKASLQEEFDKLAPKFADKEKALAEAEAAYIAQYPDRAPVPIVK